MSEVARVLDRGYALIWREGRLEDAVRGLPPDFEWVVPGHPEGDVHRGPDGVLQFFRELVEPWEDLDVEWEVHDAGPEHCIAITTMRGRGRESGAPVEMHFAQLWTHREGLVRRMELYWDVGEARRAASP